MVGAAITSRRPTAGAIGWFAFMVASWLVFAAVAVASAGTLTDLWNQVRDLPLVLEGIVWLLTLPWMLALAVWESEWSEAVRVLVVCGIAVAWTLMSVPRRNA